MNAADAIAIGCADYYVVGKDFGSWIRVGRSEIGVDQLSGVYVQRVVGGERLAVSRRRRRAAGLRSWRDGS